MEELKNQPCMLCRKPAMNLSEQEMDVPYFGKVFIFSMVCSECEFKKIDIECAEEKEPCKYTVEINSLEDLKIRVVKSSDAVVEWPDFKTKIEPGINAEGYVSNVERLLDDLYKVLEMQREGEEDKPRKKKLWNIMNDVLGVKEGKKTAILIISDPTGNSAIISEKAKKEPLKTKKK